MSSVWCAKSGCSSNAAVGKAFCVFHRNEKLDESESESEAEQQDTEQQQQETDAAEPVAEPLPAVASPPPPPPPMPRFAAAPQPQQQPPVQPPFPAPSARTSAPPPPPPATAASAAALAAAAASAAALSPPPPPPPALPAMPPMAMITAAAPQATIIPPPAAQQQQQQQRVVPPPPQPVPTKSPPPIQQQQQQQPTPQMPPTPLERPSPAHKSALSRMGISGFSNNPTNSNSNPVPFNSPPPPPPPQQPPPATGPPALALAPTPSPVAAAAPAAAAAPPRGASPALPVKMPPPLAAVAIAPVPSPTQQRPPLHALNTYGSSSNGSSTPSNGGGANSGGTPNPASTSVGSGSGTQTPNSSSSSSNNLSYNAANNPNAPPTPSRPVVSAAAASAAATAGGPAVGFNRLAATSRFSLSNNPRGGSIAQPGGSVDMSNLKTLQFMHCTHIPEVLSAQVDTGIYSVHRIIAVLKRTLAAEEDYWKTHMKNFEHENLKLERMSLDGMERTSDAWAHFQQLQIELAQKNLEGTSQLTQFVLVPLLEYNATAAPRKKELDKEMLSREKEMHASRIQVQKELHACERLIETWKELKAKEEGGPSPSGASSSSDSGSGKSANNNFPRPGEVKESAGSKLFSKFTSKISVLSFSSSAAVVEKLSSAAAKYNDALIQHNRRSEIFLTHELPHYLNELQRLEVQRLELTAQAMAAWVALSADRHATNHAIFFSDALPRTVATLDPHADIDELLSVSVSRHGFAPVWTPTPYALPVSIEDIRAGRIRSNANSVFHVSLQHLLDAQSAAPAASPSAAATASLPVPKFLLYTLDAIRACAGGKGIFQEGIFRISPSKDEMESLKRSLDTLGSSALSKNDVSCGGNVYLACALLKEWLRALSDSVVPTKDYPACIAIVKKNVAATAAAESGTGGATSASAQAETTQALNAFVASLPPVNQRVLQLLSDFVAEIVAEEPQKSNRMTIDNLSIVMAPCLLRSASEDPLELLQNSKFEIKFISLLFKCMAGAPSAVTKVVTQLKGQY